MGSAARCGDRNAGDGLASCGLAAESERRCNHALKLCDRLEGGGVAICCCGTHVLCSLFADQGVGFVNDCFCDGRIGARLLCSHGFCPQGAVGRCFASFRLARFFCDRVQIQRSSVVCAASDCRNRIRGPTSCVVGRRCYIGARIRKYFARKMPKRSARVASTAGTPQAPPLQRQSRFKCLFSANIVSYFFNGRTLA